MKRLVGVVVVLVLGLAGCGAKDTAEKTGAAPQGREFPVEFRAASDSPQPGYLKMNLYGTAREFYVSEKVDLAADIIAHAELDTLDANHPVVALTLTESGAAAFSELTRARIGKRVAIVVEGLLVSAPLVRAEITGDRAMIDGRFTLKEAERMVRKINGE
jgi:preprotein translocase subunit SecD